MTEYVILREGLAEGGNAYWEMGRVTAQTSNEAIRKHIEDSPLVPDDTTPAKYVAVPARSFKPVDVSIQQKLSVKLG